MVSLIKRMTTLRAKVLLAIRVGPGAAVLPPNVTRIHMEYAPKVAGGNYGPKRFWQNCLPRLKYHNPAVPMTVNWTTDQKGPATMTVHFTSASSTDAPPAISSTTSSQTSTGPVPASTSPAPTVRTEAIDMKHRTQSDILEEFLVVTKAVPLESTEEEKAQIKELEKLREKAEQDSARSKKLNNQKKAREELLNRAKGETATNLAL